MQHNVLTLIGGVELFIMSASNAKLGVGTLVSYVFLLTIRKGIWHSFYMRGGVSTSHSKHFVFHMFGFLLDKKQNRIFNNPNSIPLTQQAN